MCKTCIQNGNALNLFIWYTSAWLKFKCERNYVTCDDDAFSDPHVQACPMNVRAIINLDYFSGQ